MEHLLHSLYGVDAPGNGATQFQTLCTKKST